MEFLQTSDKARIPYVSDGEADQTLLLLHGGYGSYRDYALLVPHFVAAGFRTLRMEQRPHRFAELPPGADCSHSRIAQDAIELLDHLGVSSAHVAGWSHGGCVALTIADQYPGRVKSLGIYNSYGRYTQEGAGWLARFKTALFLKLAGLVPASVMQKAAPKTVLSMLNPEMPAAPEFVESYAADAQVNFGLAGVRDSMAETFALDLIDKIPQWDIPAWILSGTDDHIPSVLSEDLDRAFRDSELLMWPKGKHGLMVQHPEAVTAAHIAFMKRPRQQ